MTIHGELIAKEKDLFGYITYVFKNLEDQSFGHKYLMCTRCPNWQTRNIEIGDKGYLNYIEVQAGIDKWYDGNELVPYKYSNIYFLKFVAEADNSKGEIVL